VTSGIRASPLMTMKLSWVGHPVWVGGRGECGAGDGRGTEVCGSGAGVTAGIRASPLMTMKLSWVGHPVCEVGEVDAGRAMDGVRMFAEVVRG
jgi:hypothetical protein